MCKLLTSRPTPTQRDTGLRKNWAFLLVALALTFLLPTRHVLAPLAPGNQPVALAPWVLKSELLGCLSAWGPSDPSGLCCSACWAPGCTSGPPAVRGGILYPTVAVSVGK